MIFYSKFWLLHKSILFLFFLTQLSFSSLRLILYFQFHVHNLLIQNAFYFTLLVLVKTHFSLYSLKSVVFSLSMCSCWTVRRRRWDTSSSTTSRTSTVSGVVTFLATLCRLNYWFIICSNPPFCLCLAAASFSYDDS